MRSIKKSMRADEALKESKDWNRPTNFFFGPKRRTFFSVIDADANNDADDAIAGFWRRVSDVSDDVGGARACRHRRHRGGRAHVVRALIGFENRIKRRQNFG